MKEFIRKSQLVLQDISISLDVNVNNNFALVEINNVETFHAEDGKEMVNVYPEGVTTALDYDELDEIIIILQQASESLKRAENRD